MVSCAFHTRLPVQICRSGRGVAAGVEVAAPEAEGESEAMQRCSLRSQIGRSAGQSQRRASPFHVWLPGQVMALELLSGAGGRDGCDVGISRGFSRGVAGVLRSACMGPPVGGSPGCTVFAGFVGCAGAVGTAVLSSAGAAAAAGEVASLGKLGATVKVRSLAV